MTTVFILLAFTTLALGMAVMSQVFLQVAGLRKSSLQLDYASENGVKSGFHHFYRAVTGTDVPMVITESRSLDLMDSVRNGERRILEENLGVRFPILIKEAVGDLTWESRTDCALESLVDGGSYVAARFLLPVESRGELRYLPVGRESVLDVGLGATAGHIPLLFFPLLIDADLDPAQRATFAADHGIALETSTHNLLAGTARTSAVPLIPRDATPLLEKGLKTKLFRPQDLSNAKLRFALGLGEGDEPVPEGVYLVQDSLGLGGIYVVGDIDEMVLAVEGSYQIISFRMAAGAWTLKFSPATSRTEFVSPQGTMSYDQLPLGIVMASGRISSLGGGQVDPTGQAVLVSDHEVPSLLGGVDLTIVSADRIDISSHLVAEGLRWQNGIPYVKEEQTQLVVYTAGQKFQAEEAVEGGIVIAEAAPADIKIQASLTAQGAGFEIAGSGRVVRLVGSLQAVDYLSGGNQLNLYPCLNSGDLTKGFPAVPLTTQPVVFFPVLETLDWRDPN